MENHQFLNGSDMDGDTQGLTRKTVIHRSKYGSEDSHLVYLYDDVQIEKKRCISSCQIYRMMVSLILVSAFAICLFVWITSSVIEKRVVAKLAIQKHERVEPTPFAEALKAQAKERGVHELQKGNRQSETEVKKRNRKHKGRERKGKGKRKGRRKGKGKGRKRGRRSDFGNQHKDAVHLLIVTGEDFEVRADNNNVFIWSNADHPTSSDLVLTRAPLFEPPNDVWGVKIVRNGVYDVYSQMVVHGRSSSNLPYNCAQDIIRIRGGETTTLLRSYITQHGLGEEMFGDIAEDGVWYPLDSVYQHGVFTLQADDELRVSRPNVCDNLNFNNDPKATYFGVAQR